MKKLFTLFFLISTITAFAQLNQYPKPQEGYLTGGLGLNWIDGELHYRFNFRPEVSFANFGVGLDLNLDFDSKGNLRKENFNEFSDYLSVIRYVRYGMKNDPVFIKLGALDYYTLGHGSIIYQYNNSPSFDTRKTGLVADIDFGKFGFESIYSSFGEAGVIGLRGYVKPLQFTSAAGIPIIGNLEVGATFATDINDKAGIVVGSLDSVTNKLSVVDDKGSISIVGVDLGLPLLETNLLGIILYFDYAKIIEYGSGISTGIKLNFEGLGLVSATAKLERRFNQEKYLPSYFNSFYELERFQVMNDGTVLSKAQVLNSATTASNGVYGELSINVLKLFDIIGSYQRLDKYPNSGALHINSEIAPEDIPFLVRAGYDKVNVGNETDLFKLDDRSLLFFEFGYKPVQYLLVSMLYSWTFTPQRDADDKVVGYEPQKRIEPRISFVYPISFGGK
ncbi:MAG: hypothetical protein HXY49_09160 [Ignavibacteriaceae bacterium]|nr:hypothetical protein [Ignavibacteriaceae bacterium]